MFSSSKDSVLSNTVEMISYVQLLKAIGKKAGSSNASGKPLRHRSKSRTKEANQKDNRDIKIVESFGKKIDSDKSESEKRKQRSKKPSSHYLQPWNR